MSRSSDRNLLFGILALQMDFISRDALIAAMNAWALDKAKPLGQILVDQAHLSGERLQLLDALVAEHLRAHGDNAQQSLAALSSVSSVKQSLQAIDDPELHFSLGEVGSQAAQRDPLSTVDDAPQAGPRFRILRPHAKGGLGEISVAEDQELHREVALKEIQERHADDPHSRGRFLLEAEITGGLEHPGIVPVYSLGTYADGRPFYAMRFIKGDNLMEAISRYHSLAGSAGDGTDYYSLAFRRLLGRFVDVCQAVAYAHSRGVLHRDLKPGNIMLGTYGETLVVDWGLAKAVGRVLTEKEGDERPLRPSSGSQPGLTQVGSALGTPAYMSPEQAAGRLDELGPASDVYSLGATLYTLLTGQAAFRRQEDAGAILRQVQQGEFPKPRTVKKDVPAALEAVCLKAMALQPGERYGMALALAADVEHWLADEPVSAYPEPWSVRTRRWARQHPRLVTGLAATLLVGVVGLAVGLAAVERERARTARERDDKDKALVAEEQARSTTITVLRAITKLGVNQRDRGLIQAAELVLIDALTLQQQLAADFPTRPEFRRELAGSHHNLGLLLNATGRRADAEVAYAAALALQKQLAADFPTRPEFRQDLAGSHHNLGNLLRDTGRLPEAETAFGAALALRKQLAADFPNQSDLRNDLAGTFVNLAVLCNRRRDFQAAQAYLDEARPHHQAALKANPRHPTYRRFYRNNLWTLVNANAGLLDQTGAVQAAEMIRDLDWDPPGNAYDAACALAECIPIVEKHEQLDATQRQSAVQFYGDQALALLRDAVAKGFKDAARMKKDPALAPLRQRADFQKLLAELESKRAEKPQPPK